MQRSHLARRMGREGRLLGLKERNGERVDTVHPARPAFWPTSLFLAVQRRMLASVAVARCAILYSFGKSFWLGE
jgi:hypothetical protein